ncbi:MAG: hypothetical protein ABGX26_01375 [Nautiliaceae bacterium]|jgi:ADP-heptose:LPS heptosyltransferase
MRVEEFDDKFFEMLKTKFKNAKIKIIIKEDETEYLLKNKANREFLMKSIAGLKKMKL